MAPPISNALKEKYRKMLQNEGEEGIYKTFIGAGMLHLQQSISSSEDNIDVVLLDRAEMFFDIYRKTNDDDFFILGKACRRAGHTLYRLLLNQNKRNPNFERFLNAV